MGLDIRVPIGWLFTILGALLAIFGLIDHQTVYTWSPSTNINLVWGVVLLLFGALMLVLSRRAAAAARLDTHPPRSRRTT